jgi:methanogenic corrinoid protein MtbC1
MLEDIITPYNEAVFDTDRERALGVIRAALDSGVSAEEIVFEVVIPAIERMVKSISEDFDTNLAQHYVAAQIAAEVTSEMVTRFARPPRSEGRVVIGTAYGDLHTLGKRIVTGCLKSLMIDVKDLGVNVTPERFVDEAVAWQAQVIGVSAMMLHTARGDNGALGVRRLLDEQHLADRIKLIVGGAPYRFQPDLYRLVGADAWAADGIAGGHVILDLIKEVNW